MDGVENIWRWILDVIGKIAALPLIIIGTAMLYVGRLVLDATHKEY